MKKIKKNWFKLDCGFFPVNIHLIGSEKALYKCAKKEGFSVSDLGDTSKVDAYFSQIECDDGLYISFIFCPKGTSIDILLHEIVHAVDYVFMDLGVDHSAENTETRAYLTQHLFKQALSIEN